TWAHIFCEGIAIDDAVEALKAVSHGDRPRGFVTVVAGPAAEPGDGPPGPGQGIGRMRILLLGSAPLQLLLEGVQDLNLGSVEDVAGRLVSSSGGAREHELHG